MLKNIILPAKPDCSSNYFASTDFTKVQEKDLWKTSFSCVPCSLVKRAPFSSLAAEGFSVQKFINCSLSIHLFLEFHEDQFSYLGNLLVYEVSDSSNENR